jgi:SAM-dependent methyltransferase
MSLEVFAAAHEEEFDLALAVFVLEHVGDPAGFVRACARVLRPGGSLFALTLNVTHYFGAATWALSRVGLSDRVLELMKGHAEVHDHHFPPEYRLNSVRTVQRHLDAAGFHSVEFRCYDASERYQWYLPVGLRWFAPTYTRAAYAVGAPALMGHLAFRAVR